MSKHLSELESLDSSEPIPVFVSGSIGHGVEAIVAHLKRAEKLLQGLPPLSAAGGVAMLMGILERAKSLAEFAEATAKYQQMEQAGRQAAPPSAAPPSS